MERMKTWMTVLLVLCVAMAVTMKENMVGLLLGMWASEPNTFPYDLDNRLQASQVRFAGELMGPESLAFDREGRGPYTGVSDGRILRWDGPRNGWFHFAHTSPHRLLRYWLKGPKTGSMEVFAFLPSYPDNVRLNENGDFWVAIHAFPNPFLKIPVNTRRLILRIPLPWTQIFSKVSAKRGRGMIIGYGIDGQVLEVLEDRDGLVVKSVSEVEEKDGLLWLGSVLLPHIVVYNRTHHGYSHM